MLGREGSDIDGGTESLGGTVEVGVSGTGLRGLHLYGDKARDGKYGKGRSKWGVTGHEGAGGGSHDEVNLF
jgi:hypothetical protein